VKALTESGIDILLVTFASCPHEEYVHFTNLKILDFSLNQKNVWYIYKELLKEVDKYNPDIIHAHYATRYGLWARLCKRNPLIISVWGSDILLFPHYSFIHYFFIKWILWKADIILATSHYLEADTKKFTSHPTRITPFGVDTNKFIPGEKIKYKNEIVIGSIKSLHHNYGQEDLILAFKSVKDRNPGIPLRLLLVGDGISRVKLEEMVKTFNLSEYVTFTGHVSNNFVCSYYTEMDIGVYLSDSESFGVCVLESFSCEIPVIVSQAGGYVELVDDGSDGFIVDRKNQIEIVQAIEKLINDKDLRKKMGVNGREKVLQKYSWDCSVEIMLNIYKELYD
jgi:glycosyltransferase involved in cell wall biosynthesis